MFNRLFKKIYVRIEWIARVILDYFGFKRTYKIDKINIKINFTHRLPDYKKDHFFYDKFLPHFSEYLPSDTAVIDVGANVGDTVVGMCQKNPRLQYVCIEANNDYYNNLVENIKILKKKFPTTKLYSLNKFIGKDIDKVSLKRKNGTSITSIGGNIRSETLFSALKYLDIKNISLLKTDVDGFDYDVLRASYSSLTNKTYIYFECEFLEKNQFQNFKNVLSELYKKKYNNFALFDNFGQFICYASNLEQLFQLLNYVMVQNRGIGTRTFYYYDVLAFKDIMKKNVKKIINVYSEFKN